MRHEYVIYLPTKMKERNVTGPVSLGRLCLLPDVATSLSQLNVPVSMLEYRSSQILKILQYVGLHYVFVQPYVYSLHVGMQCVQTIRIYIYTCRHHFEHSLPKVMSRLLLKYESVEGTLH